MSALPAPQDGRGRPEHVGGPGPDEAVVDADEEDASRPAEAVRTGLTPVPGVGIGAGFILFSAGAIAGRADVVLFGIVLIVAVAVALGRPRPAVQPRLTLKEKARDGADAAGANIVLGVEAPGTEVVAVTVIARSAETLRAVFAPGRDKGTASINVPLIHTGLHEIAAAQARAAGADAAWIGQPSQPLVLRRIIQSLAVPVPFLPLPASLRGLTGAHDATRAGDGGEFRDIHPYTSGDRLRRIDWKATARLGRRPGDLYVRRTHATSDVDVAIVMDDGDDIDGVLPGWIMGDRLSGLTTSMDIAREAAWSLASAYLASADQVSFQVLSRARGAVQRGSGARHRERLRAAIMGAEPQLRYARVRTPTVPPGALVVVLSTFLDDEPGRLVGLWRAAGHRVLAVDTLPRLENTRMRREMQAAARVILGEREDRLADVRAVGADLLVWDAPQAERVAALRSMTRVRRNR